MPACLRCKIWSLWHIFVRHPIAAPAHRWHDVDLLGKVISWRQDQEAPKPIRRRTPSLWPRSHCPRMKLQCWTAGSGQRTTCQSVRSTCWTTRCYAVPSRPPTSSPACSGTGAPLRLNFIYAHLNRVIRRDDRDMLYIAGPGHGRPRAMVANAWLGQLLRVLPGHRPRRARHAGTVQAVLLPRRNPVACRSRDPGFHPRRWRAGIQPQPCVRSRIRQPGSDRGMRDPEMAKPRPDRWQPPGTARSSSTRSLTARCCRSCTSMATRSRTRPFWPDPARGTHRAVGRIRLEASLR